MNEKPKILIADDSEINRALLKEILGDGYDYLEAEDGAAAVELMRQRTDISLLLLDLMMPGMDGFDVLRVMKYTHGWTRSRSSSSRRQRTPPTSSAPTIWG